jgi:hypothetical protein
MKKLLHLYNYGHNPFPKLGKGGLGYHLPQYKIKGGTIIVDENDEIIEDDGDDDNPVLLNKDKNVIGAYDRDSMDVVRGLNTDAGFHYNSLLGFSRTNTDKIDYPEYNVFKKYGRNRDEILNRVDFEVADKAFDKLQVEFDKEQEENKKVDDDDEEEKKMESKEYLSIYKYISRKDILSILEEYGFDVEDIPKSWSKGKIIKELIMTDDSLLGAFYDISLENEKSKTSGLPVFDIPDISITKLNEKDIKPIIDTDLISPDESYSDVVNNINSYSKKPDIYSSLFPNFKLKKESIDYKKTFALKNPVKDLTVEIDDEEYKPTGGIDFELKVKNNMPFFKAIVDQYLGVDATIISVKPDATGYDKADYIIEVKMKGDDKSIFIDLELKKYMTEQGIKGQDLAAYRNKSAFDSIDKINEGTTTLFNNWFYTFKKELQVLYGRCKDKKNFTEYNSLLNSVSTDNKFDSQKLLMKHVISGKYFPLPLTITKFKTPSREIIDTTMKKRYPKDIHLHTAVSDYMYGHWKRLNKSDNILIPVLLINDGILSMNVRQKFGNLIPFEVLQIINNIYSHNEKDALGLPACFLSNVNLPPEALSISSGRSDVELRNEYKKEILEKKEAIKNKPRKQKPTKIKNIDL